MTENGNNEHSDSPLCSLAFNPWQFACDWYDVDGIHACLQRMPNQRLAGDERYGQIPEDHTSREFAEWLAHEYRLAMTKGIQIGQSDSYRKWCS